MPETVSAVVWHVLWTLQARTPEAIIARTPEAIIARTPSDQVLITEKITPLSL